MNSSEFTEDFFEECAVIEILESRVGLAVLRGENMPLNVRSSKAQNTLAIPDSVIECNDEILAIQTCLKEGEFPRRYVDTGHFLGISALDLTIGQIAHYHQGRSGDEGHTTTQICISPNRLMLDEVNAMAQAQLEIREEQLRRHVADIRSERYYERTSIERIDPQQPFRLFENAEVRYDESGKQFVFIPDRIFTSEKRGVERIRVVATILTPDDEESSGWESRYTAGGNEFVKELHQPFEDYDLGVPMVKVDVYTSGPLGGHKKAREEQKLELTINGVRYWSKIDPEYLLFAGLGPDQDVLHMTDRGFDDYIDVEHQSDGDLLYCDFQAVGDPKPNLLYKALGSEELESTGNASPAKILLPLDLIILGEIEAEFPGLF